MTRQNNFLPGPSDAFYSHFNAKEEYEQRFYQSSYDSYPGSGNWEQFEEMAPARQSSSTQVAQATTQTQNCSSK